MSKKIQIDIGGGKQKEIELSSEEGLEILRHTTAHVMAQAVKRLFPDAKYAIGPTISDGFYYDFDLEHKFVPEDLPKIEAVMNKIVKENIPLERREVSLDEAKGEFKKLGESYKLELLEEIAEGPVSLYGQGDFLDLCRGPHLPSTGRLNAFKLLSLAGAYWRGDEKKQMLQRIYGTAFAEKKELAEHLEMREEAEKRDHRRLGKALEYFSIFEQAGPGLIHWLPKGGRLRDIIESFWRREHYKRGYELVYTPHIAKAEMWRKSGHLENFKDDMYAPMDVDGQEYYIKPMNCPAHILMYKTRKRSYRELPMRWGELGTVYRYERSGVLHGMLRVRGFTQDDAHIFCTPEQIVDELVGTIELMQYMMKAFGFDKYVVTLSTRPETSIGNVADWETATQALKKALKSKNMEYQVDEGGGAFYGPKIDIQLIDAIGRGWQGPTIQCDFNIPERLDVNYVDKDGKEKRVVMVHRTVLGSMERFVGCLLEHHAGALPTWLSPLQVIILPVSEKFMGHADKVSALLKEAGVRVEVDWRNEKLGYKIRDAQLKKIPYMGVVGAKEQEGDGLAPRSREKGDLGFMTVEAFLEMIKPELEP